MKNLTQQPVLASPIPLGNEDILEVQEMYFKEFGEKISPEEARVEIIKVLLSVKASFKPIPKEKSVANPASIEYGVLRGNEMK